MSKIVWDDELYSVGISRIDNEHKQLIGLINAVYDMKQKNREYTYLKKILNTLVEYTETHFTKEEKLMEKMGYPKLYEHHLQHKTFIDRLNYFIKMYEEEPHEERQLDQIINFLGSWLSSHILVLDKEYEAFLFDDKK
ncbi:MAG: bacteriohemerythrin [Bdellovibrionales bacterium]